jgi:hypothetical protein
MAFITGAAAVFALASLLGSALGGAILLVGLGLSDWFTGIGYGLGFALPFLALLWTHRVGRLARTPGPVDPGLKSMLGKRKAMQVLSASLLTAGGAILTSSIMLS